MSLVGGKNVSRVRTKLRYEIFLEALFQYRCFFTLIYPLNILLLTGNCSICCMLSILQVHTTSCQKFKCLNNTKVTFREPGLLNIPRLLPVYNCFLNDVKISTNVLNMIIIITHIFTTLSNKIEVKTIFNKSNIIIVVCFVFKDFYFTFSSGF